LRHAAQVSGITERGYGIAGVRGGEPFVEVLDGEVPFECIEYEARS
jgi:hypothetical protein